MGTAWNNGIASDTEAEDLSTAEARGRYENLIVGIISELVVFRMVVLVSATRMSSQIHSADSWMAATGRFAERG